MPITKFSKFKGETQHHVLKLWNSASARHYCAKFLRVLGTLGTHANSSPVKWISLKFTFGNLKPFLKIIIVLTCLSIKREIIWGEAINHLLYSRKYLRRWPGFDPITFSENSNNLREKFTWSNKAKNCWVRSSNFLFSRWRW